MTFIMAKFFINSAIPISETVLTVLINKHNSVLNTDYFSTSKLKECAANFKKCLNLRRNGSDYHILGFLIWYHLSFFEKTGGF